MPEISIIIPCYNAAPYLMRCFESLKKQTIGTKNLELIFVDDASTDDTWNLLCEIEKSASDYVCAVHLDENLRQGGARNVGLSYASGNYIGFVDSDDWVEPDMYELMYQNLIDTDSDLVFCRNFRDNGKMKFSSRDTNKKDEILFINTPLKRNDFIVSNLIGYCVWDKLYRKDFLLDNHILFPEKLAYEDIYFGSLIYLYTQKVSILEKRLYHYYINEESTVLGRNLAYHNDIFTVNYLKWEVLQNRGFYPLYKDALDFDFLMTFYFATFKILCLRYDQIPFDSFLELKKNTLQRIPGILQNPYCKTHVTPLYQIILELLNHTVTKDSLYEIQVAFCNYYHMLKK